MKKLKSICMGIVCGMFVSNLLFTTDNLFSKVYLELKHLYAMNMMVVFASVIGGLIFKEGVAPLEKWIRRGVVILLYSIAGPSFLWLCGCLDHTCGHTSYELAFKIFAIFPPVVIAYSVIAFIIGDVCEKKYLEKINKRLSEHVETE